MRSGLASKENPRIFKGEVLCSGTGGQAAGGAGDRAELLRRFLQAYWLRPENALWMTLRSEALRACPFESPSIDVSCGDGVFSFLHCGGVFDPSFDVFLSVAPLEKVHGAHADMFDHEDNDYAPMILSPPHGMIDVGTDVKVSMIAKARRLGLYHRLLQHDNNQPLPFPDGMFKTVYCNAAYWVCRIEPFLRELRRITHHEGRIILQVKLDAMRNYTLEAFRAALGDRFLDLIGRGRMDYWPTLADRGTWEDRFVNAGLSIEKVQSFVSRTHAHIWDIGLRPLAPLLIRMTQEISATSRATIKREWVDLFHELLKPFCDPNLDLLPGQGEPAELQYVLHPRPL